MGPKRFIFMAALIGTFLLIFSACASIQIKKIDPSSQELSGPSGVRYYLPRPYVAVSEPFVIFSKSYVVNAELSPDGQYVLLRDVPDEFKDKIFIRKDGMGITTTRALKKSQIDSTVKGVTQSEETPEQEPDKKKEGSKGDEIDEEEKPKTEIKSGMAGIKLANDNTGIPVTPLRRYFDIIWLPDFDEQYIVISKSGLGNVSTVLQTGQGWSLNGLEALVDNSSLTKPLLAFYESTFSALQKLTTAKITAPLDIISGVVQSEAEIQKAGAAAFKGGIPISLKLVFVRVATPGLYPILKPKELAEINKYYNDNDVKSRILLPVPPLTNIAFNTYETFYMEAVHPSGDSAFDMVQYKQSDEEINRNLSEEPRTSTPETPSDLKSTENGFNSVLMQKEKVAPNGDYYFVQLIRAGSEIIVTVKVKKGGKQGSDKIPYDQKALKRDLISHAKINGKIIEDKNISFEQ
jgi:hypothetical protein